MFKLIGAVVCGTAAAGAVAYFAMRPKEYRTTDVEQTKKAYNSAVDATKKYFSGLFNTKPAAPPTQA